MIKKIIKKWAEKVGNTIYNNKFKFLALTIIPAVLLIGTQISKLKVDTSIEGFLLKNDPDLVNYEAFKEQFRRDDLIVLGIKSENIFSKSIMQKINQLHMELEDKVPHLTEVKSLINARVTRGVGDVLIVEDLFETWPTSVQDYHAIKNYALSNPFYKNLFLSEDGKFTVITIELDTYAAKDFDPFSENIAIAGKQNAKSVNLSREEIKDSIEVIKNIIVKYDSDEMPIYLVGSPVSTGEVSAIIQKDMKRLTGICLLAIAIFLFVFFRRLSGVVLPVIIIMFSLLITISLMALFKVPIKTPTTILPNFILAVGVSGAVHLLTIFYQYLQVEKNKKDAIIKTLEHSGFPVIITSLTTAAGVISFSFVDVAPVVDVGIYASAGVVISLIYILFFLPAAVAAVPIKKKKSKTKKIPIIQKSLESIGLFAVNRHKEILICSIILALFSIIGVTKIKFSHNSLKWLPENSKIRNETEIVEKEMKGAVSLELVIDTKKKNGLYEYKVLEGIDKLASFLENNKDKLGIHVGQTISLVDILKETHRALNENKIEFYSLPQTRQAIAQELLLFSNSGSEHLEKVVDGKYSKARFTVKVPIVDAISYIKFINIVKNELEHTFNKNIKITFTGYMALLAKTMSAIIFSMQKSYPIAAIIISMLMVILIGNLRIGLLSMIPNFFPILITLGVIGWFNIPLDASLIMIGSISLGLAVDDTIHYMWNFKRYYEEYKDVKIAVKRTMVTTGQAMLLTSIILTLGFFIFMFSTLNNIISFGFLTGMSIFLAFIADCLVSPAILSISIKKYNEMSDTEKMLKIKCQEEIS